MTRICIVKAETMTDVILLQVRTVLQKTNERLSIEVTPFPKDITSLGDQTAKSMVIMPAVLFFMSVFSNHASTIYNW